MPTQSALGEHDVAALSETPLGMARAWNRGDANHLAAPFSTTADFIAFEGTDLRGRHELVAFHRHIFATVVKGSRLDGSVRFVRDHRCCGHPLCGERHAGRPEAVAPDHPSAGRESMQLFVVVRTAGG
jgi:hypothetical protein